MYALCPTDPTHGPFRTIVSVTEEWLANGDGALLERLNFVEGPAEGDSARPWFCMVCGAVALTGEGDAVTLREARRREWVGQYVDYFADENQPIPDGAEDGRYLLIEHNVGGSSPPYWITAHDSLEAAAAYHDEQEYVDDWQIELLVDLDTGLTYDGDTNRTTTFTAQP